MRSVTAKAFIKSMRAGAAHFALPSVRSAAQPSQAGREVHEVPPSPGSSFHSELGPSLTLGINCISAWSLRPCLNGGRCRYAVYPEPKVRDLVPSAARNLNNLKKQTLASHVLRPHQRLTILGLI